LESAAFSALKKSGSIEATAVSRTTARTKTFSALKKSGSIEAGLTEFGGCIMATIFRFEKKRLH